MKTQHAQTKSNSRYLRTFCFIQLNINFGYLSVNNSINVLITAFPRLNKWNILTNCLADRGVSCCPHETTYGRSWEFMITEIVYAQTHNPSIIWLYHDSRSWWMAFPWNKPVHEIMVPIAYASSEGSDEPVHLRKSSAPSGLTASIEGM